MKRSLLVLAVMYAVLGTYWVFTSPEIGQAFDNWYQGSLMP